MVDLGTFRRWIPFEVVEKADPDGKKRLRIVGIASTEHKDRQGDRIKQGGLDFEPFLKYGFFNDNHSKKTTDVLGYPERVTPVEIEDENGQKVKATAVEGYLLDTPEARKIADLAMSLRGTPRQLGFSVEGDIQGRSGEWITKAEVRHVAITNCPVNPHASLGLVKSMHLLDRLVKGATAGTGSRGPNPGSIGALMPESLGGVARLSLPGAGDPMAAMRRSREITDEWLKANGGLALTKSQAARIIQCRLPSAPAGTAARIYALARTMGEAR